MTRKTKFEPNRSAYLVVLKQNTKWNIYKIASGRLPYISMTTIVLVALHSWKSPYAYSDNVVRESCKQQQNNQTAAIQFEVAGSIGAYTEIGVAERLRRPFFGIATAKRQTFTMFDC